MTFPLRRLCDLVLSDPVALAASCLVAVLLMFDHQWVGALGWILVALRWLESSVRHRHAQEAKP